MENKSKQKLPWSEYWKGIGIFLIALLIQGGVIWLYNLMHIHIHWLNTLIYFLITIVMGYCVLKYLRNQFIKKYQKQDVHYYRLLVMKSLGIDLILFIIDIIAGIGVSAYCGGFRKDVSILPLAIYLIVTVAIIYLFIGFTSLILTYGLFNQIMPWHKENEKHQNHFMLMSSVISSIIFLMFAVFWTLIIAMCFIR